MPPAHAITALAALVLAGTLWAGARPVGPLPPLGPLLDPANGAWAAAAGADLPREQRAAIPGLGAETRVEYDDRGVPHIFAASEEDALRALGWVVARDRLFQMEMQTLAASGRLTEIAGARALPLDREMRSLGMPEAAERKLAALGDTGSLARLVRAYAEGVNAYIDGLRPRDWPLEYRILGRAPARWRPIDTFHLMNRMGWTLAYGEEELRHARVAARVGGAAAAALYPVDAPVQEPIQPNGAGGPRWATSPLPPPGAPEEMSVGEGHASAAEPDDALGSNNWAVAPGRAAGGHALLAGDPHLELTLPSIWYEVHLVVPGRLDVYGVTIPGAPGIVIGFNRDIAWTFTNTDADVTDYYVETVDDPARPTRYRLDGEWRPLRARIERYLGKAGEVVATDTIRFTHRGPMRRLGDRWVSMRWTVLESTRDIAIFPAIARARTVEEFRRGSEAWGAPAQNMLVADRAGAIAIRSTGRFPIRPGSGRGDLLRDGSRRAEDWTGDWAPDEYPQAVRPAQGFLASANQQPLDPRDDPRYLGAGWYAPWRALRINELLRADSSVTPDEMRRWQTDPVSVRARTFLPALLAAARAREPGSAAARAGALLAQWDGRYTRDNERAVLFEEAMRELEARLWDELRAPDERDAPSYPQSSVAARLLREPESAWWDARATPGARERRDDILAQALAAALDSVTARHGPPDAGGWRWDGIRHANIWHLLRLPSLSALDVPLQGGPSLLNPSSGNGTFGASWRMVVELGPELRAWATYPGGQSGNPSSPRYRDRLDRWSAGELDSLRVPRRPGQLGRAISTLTLVPERAR